MSGAEVAADLFKRDREAEQAFESIALNFARPAATPTITAPQPGINPRCWR